MAQLGRAWGLPQSEHWGSTGIMEQKMEATRMGLKVCGLRDFERQRAINLAAALPPINLCGFALGSFKIPPTKHVLQSTPILPHPTFQRPGALPCHEADRRSKPFSRAPRDLTSTMAYWGYNYTYYVLVTAHFFFVRSWD